MKKIKRMRTTLLVMSAVLATMSLTLFAGPTANTNIFINGEHRAIGFIEDGRTFIPLRDVSEALGAIVDWNAKTKAVTITKDGTTIIQKIGDTAATVNGKKVEVGAPALIKTGKTYVPLRFVSETLGTDVKWDTHSRTVQITALGAPSKSEADQAKWEILVKNATPIESFASAAKPVTSYTSIENVPLDNLDGGIGPYFDKFSTITKDNLPIRETIWCAVLAIEESTYNGRRTVTITREVSNRNIGSQIIYANKKTGFLTRASNHIPGTTETLAELNIHGGQKTFVVRQKYFLPTNERDGVEPSDIDGIAFRDVENYAGVMIKMNFK